jgi:outer membrane protein TolC
MNEHTEKSYLDRPEILALDEAEQALEYKFKSEVSGYLPKVQAFATHQYAGFTNGELGVIAFNEISAYPINALGIGMKWELFDGLHTRNERIKARIELEQAQNKKEEVRQLLELNYRNSMSKFKTLTAQTALKKEQLKSSQESMDISYKEYKNGLIQLSDFLEAQARFTTSVLDYYETLCSQRDTSLELLKATGSLKIKYL